VATQAQSADRRAHGRADVFVIDVDASPPRARDGISAWRGLEAAPVQCQPCKYFEARPAGA
jgi:hypothetical protein